MREVGPSPEERKEGLRIGAESIADDRHPDHIEDRYLILPNKGAAAVFDGVGGSKLGEAAAKLAAEGIKAKLLALAPDLPADELDDALKAILRDTDQEIRKEIQDGSTTATIVLARNDAGLVKLTVANVADSRAYIMDSGGLHAITIDNQTHPYDEKLEAWIRAQQTALDSAVSVDDLPQEAKGHFAYGRFKISQSLGNLIEPIIYHAETPPGSKVLLSTDGVHDNLTSEEIAGILQQHDDPSEASKAMVHAAQVRSRDESHPRHKTDDMTAVVIQL